MSWYDHTKNQIGQLPPKHDLSLAQSHPTCVRCWQTQDIQILLDCQLVARRPGSTSPKTDGNESVGELLHSDENSWSLVDPVSTKCSVFTSWDEACAVVRASATSLASFTGP